MGIKFTHVAGDGGDIDLSGVLKPSIVRATDNSETIKTTGVDDRVRAGGGDDIVITGHGRDRVWAGEGNDDVQLGVGRDFGYGGAGNDTLDGGKGNDRLVGGADNDRLIGGDGDDVIFGDSEFGVDGTAGADVFVFDKNDGNDRVWDFAAGVDTVELTEGSGDVSFDYKGDNTIMTYGSTTVTFYNAVVDADDLVFV